MPTEPFEWAMACKECGHVFPDNITVVVAAVHMKEAHALTDVSFDLVWVGNRECTDARWTPCPKSATCYRPYGHNGACIDRSTIKRTT